MPESHHIASRHYAFEGRCFLICAASYLRSSNVPTDFELADLLQQGVEVEVASDGAEIMPGGSGVNRTRRRVAGRARVRSEEVVTAEIDLDRISEEHQALDAAGHYNRPDVFRITVDERPKDQVTWLH